MFDIKITDHTTKKPVNFTKYGEKDFRGMQISGVIFQKIMPDSKYETKIELSKYFEIKPGQPYSIEVKGSIFLLKDQINFSTDSMLF